MKKNILLLAVILPILSWGKVHYAKVEPLERTTVKSAVSGAILHVDLSSEGKLVGDEVVIQIDDTLDRASLETSTKSIALLKESLLINDKVLSGLKEALDIKSGYLVRISSLATSTTTQKENANSALIAARNQFLGTSEKITTLKKQILDMEYKIKMLEDTISKKSIRFKNRYLYKLMVRAGEFANPGLPLAVADDLSKAKVVIYLDRDELDGIEGKKAYIDGEESGMAITHVWREADEKFISSYRAEIIMEPKYPFSTLLKIEVK
jgi:multidrug resistance efflux pump